MSKYVSQMKHVLVTLNTTAQKTHKDMERNSRDFTPDVAAEVNARLQAELNKAADTARAQIDNIHRTAAAAARKWREPIGENVDAADLKLLCSSFTLSPMDLNRLVVKHQDNGTMVNAIAKYAKEHQVVLDYVPCVEDKLFAYQSFAQSAHNLIGSIVHSVGLADNGLSLAKWGDRGNISQRVELALYGISQCEEPGMVPPAGDFNFNFKPLSGR